MTPKLIVNAIEIRLGMTGEPRQVRDAIERELLEQFNATAAQAAEKTGQIHDKVVSEIARRRDEREAAGEIAIIHLRGSPNEILYGSSFVFADDSLEIRTSKLNRISVNEIYNSIRNLTFSQFELFGRCVLRELGCHSSNKGMLPTSKVEVYEDYIRGRLDRLKQTLQDYVLTQNEVGRIATLIAYEMFSHSHVGLEAQYYELRNWIEQKLQVANLRNAIDVLERARLVRRSPFPAERISFVHRRFNEYFLARAAEIGLTPIDMESITHDRRDRDALVLYVELAPDDEVRRILQFCWNQIAVTGNAANSPVVDEPARLRATYSLRFLVDAFTSSKKHLIDIVVDEFHAFLLSAVEAHGTDMLHAKIAVEAAGVLSDRKASEVIVEALLTENNWIMETAVRASRNIQNITTEASTLITKYVWQMPEAETLRRRRDLVDLFRLNQPFAFIPFIINFKAVALLVQWPIRICAVLSIPVEFFYTILAQMILQLIRPVENLNRLLIQHIQFNISRIENTFTFAALFIVMIICVKKVFQTRPAQPIQEFSPIFAYLHETESFVVFLLLSTIGISHIAILYYSCSKVTARWFLAKIIPISVFGIVGYSFYFALESLHKHYFIYYFLISCLLAYFTLGALFSITPLWLSFVRQRRELDAAPDIKFDDRREIETLFRQLDSSYLRSRLVRRIEDYHRKKGTMPNGQWSAGAAPNLFDRASIRLSQLDEMWTGLER